MKKILIIIGSFEIGGTVVSLYSLLSKIDSSKVCVDVFSRQQSGEYINCLPNCNILPENVWLSHSVKNKKPFARLFTLSLLVFRKLMEFIRIDMFKIYCMIGGQQLNAMDYDAIIGFDETLSRFLSYMPARKRINWIHCDYRRYAQGRDETKYYDKINDVICVSDFVKGVFSEVYPKYSGKTTAIHNVINVEDIIAKSNATIDDNRFDTSSFTILSCGRLDPVKQFHLIPSIAEKVHSQAQKPFKWYIIGGGCEDEKNKITKEISSRGLEDTVVMLGKKTNVYPYMAKANLYVSTSYSESFPMAVNEAKALCVPIVCNTFPSASESVSDGVNGYIRSIEEMPNIIALMMENPLIIVEYGIDGDAVMEQIYDLF